MSTKIVEGIEYISEEIPGKGVCLVPKRTNKDILKTIFSTFETGVFYLYCNDSDSMKKYVAKVGVDQYALLFTCSDGSIQFNGYNQNPYHAASFDQIIKFWTYFQDNDLEPIVSNLLKKKKVSK